MADALALQLPGLITADNWRTEQQPEAIGTIKIIPSTPGIITPCGQDVVHAGDSKTTTTGVLVDYSILVIQQTRRVHFDIAAEVQKLLHGDPLEMPPVPAGMNGGSWANFERFLGGGFPSIRE